jgi:hypothetical protein
MELWFLKDDQKQRRRHILSDLLRNAKVFNKVITDDELWCFQYDREAKRHSVRWKTTEFTSGGKTTRFTRSPRPQDHKGIVHC